MKKTLSLLLVIIVCVTAIIAFVPTIKASAAHSVVMTADEFIGYLQYVVDRGDSRYASGGEKSIGKYDGKYIYFDCWGLGESIICTKGQIVYNKNKSLDPWSLWDTSCGCGSKTGNWLKSQSELSTDFSNILPGEWLFRDKADGNCYHVGYYIGNGKVIEATSDGSYNTQITTIDSSGRSNIRGSSWKWTSHGKVPWISYCNCEEINDYADDGKCNSCGTYFDFESTKTDATGIYGVTKEISPSTTPYKATRDTSTTFKAGTAVEVIGKYKNAFDNTWYKISYGNGKTGYLFEENLKEVAPIILPSYVLAAATTKTEVMSLPCSTGTNSTSYKKAELKKDETFDVIQIVKNTAGNYWYKVITAAGDEGWVWCEETKVKSFDSEPKSIIIGSDFPSTIPKAGRHIDYKVQTTYSNIQNVQGAIYNGTATSGTAVCKGTADAGQKKYINLYGTDLDYALTFGSLTEGKQYTLVITANLVYGYYDYDSDSLKSHEYSVSRAWTFTVKSSSSSSCSHTYDNACDTTCNKCGATRSTSHTYDNSCDTSCNTCGAARSISHTYDNSCDTSCSVCGATRSISHTYVSDCDAVCEVCWYYREDTIPCDKEYTYVSDSNHSFECKNCENYGVGTHTSHEKVFYNANQHFLYCVYCEGLYEYADHTYTNDCDNSCNGCEYVRTASHTYDNACDPSCNVCGETRDVSHNYVFKNDEIDIFFGNHWQECTKCGLKINEGEHDWRIESIDEDYCGRYYCGVCYTDFILVHAYNNDCDPTCDTCGAIRTVSGHDYDNTCDTTCNICGATRATSHDYDNACDPSCNVCGATRTTNHKYSNPCDKNCDACGATRSVPGHVYDHACDTSCNNCGYSRSTSHTYSNNCDPSCNVCGAQRTVSHTYTSRYLSNATSHWRTCTACGYNGYIEAHIPGSPATETSPQRCIVCEFVIQEAIGHTHQFGTDYEKDSQQHWHECSDKSCGAKADIEDHIFDFGVVNKEPTTTEKGEMLFTCTVCGEEKREDIDTLPGGPVEPEDPETPKDPELPDDSKIPEVSVKPTDKTSSWGPIIAIAVIGAVVGGGVILTAAVATVVIVVKKQSVKVKTTGDEKDDNENTNNDIE